MKKLHYSICVSLTALLLMNSAVVSAETPNIIVIMADDLGYGDVGCYGAQPAHVATPNIDRLANEGLRFTSGYCSNSTCTPTRYTLLTGQYAFRKSGTGIGGINSTLKIDVNRTTLADMLKSAGYVTAVIGKWHLGLGSGSAPNWNGALNPGPLELGFDHCFLLPNTNDRVPSVYVEDHAVVNLDPADPLTVSGSQIPNSNPYSSFPSANLTYTSSGGHKDSVYNGVGRIGYFSGGTAARWRDEDMADDFINKALPWIEANTNTPFFLYFASQDCHVPRLPHERFQGQSALGWRGDAIVQVDWCVGQIIDKIEALGIADNTMILFCSDNGPVLDDGYNDDAVTKDSATGHAAAGPYRGGKYSVYEGGTRTPFITWWPGRIATNTVSDEMVCSMDLARSFASLTGQTVSGDAFPDSFDVMDALLGVNNAKGRDHLIQANNKGNSLGFREGNWKIVKNSELYNLDSDPGEQNNLAGANPDKLASMIALRNVLTQSSSTASGALAAIAGDGSVSLDWLNSSATNFASYKVYRSTTSGEPYSEIAGGLIDSEYVDNGVTNGIPYFYVVTTTYSDGSQSPFGNEVSATPEELPTPEEGILIDYVDTDTGNGIHDVAVRDGAFELDTPTIGFGVINGAYWGPITGAGTTYQIRDNKVSPNGGGHNTVVGLEGDGVLYRQLGQDTGHVLALGDQFNSAFDWMDASGWGPGETIDMFLYYTDDDTLNGARTTLFLLNSGNEVTGGAWESETFATTAAVTDAGAVGKKLFVSFEPNGVNASSWARLDNVYLQVIGDLPPTPVIAAFTATPSAVESGGSVTLSWQVTNAETLSLDQGIGDVTGMTSTQIVVLADTTYTLIAENAEGSTTSSVPVTLILPPPPNVISFTANDYSVTNGASIMLDWQVSGADYIEIDQRVGIVAGTGTTSVVVTPPALFTLTATNANGTSVSHIQIAETPGRPNIIFFLVDDMGSQDTSVPFYHDTNGNPVVTDLNNLYRTPSMETLAAAGMKFTSAYATPICSPTRASFMTGMNSARHHVTTWLTSDGGAGAPPDWRVKGLDATDILLPQLLQADGYHTIHCGKGHMGNNITSWGGQISNLGFDVNIAGNFIGRPGEYMGDYGAGGNRAVPGIEAYHNSGIFLTEVLTLEVNKAIEDAVTNGLPFFTYMSHYAVHAPYTADPRFTGNYPTLASGTTALKFATMLEGMDKSLGDIIDKVNALGVGEDTLIIFMGDNGSAVNNNVTPLRGKKGSKYEGGSRVPMIVGWANPNPANPFQSDLPIPAGSFEDDLVTVFDMFPTILETAGVSYTHPIDGYNLRPYFAGIPGTHRPQEYTINFPHTSDYFSTHRVGDWKLVYTYNRTTETGSSELYHLATDPGEQTDLAGSESDRVMFMTRDMAQKLEGLDAQFCISTGLNPIPPTIPNLPSIDVDNDGIPDNIEDPNSNGLVDPGETNPDNDNTDGDGTVDGAEVRTGTDPLNPSSDFVGEWVAEEAGGFTATWPSAPGAVYEIQTTDDLTEWIKAPLATGIPASNPGTTTSYVIPANGNAQRFFRIGLLP